MSLFLIALVSISSIIISRIVFRQWFNHLAIYSIVWGGMIYLYEIKLIRYLDIIPEAWFIIVVSFTMFLLGAITPFVMVRDKNPIASKKEFEDLFADNGKIFSYFVYFIGFMSLGLALYNWWILFKMYHSIVNIFLSANIIYRMRVEAEIPGMIPYLGGITFSGLILSAIYTVYKNRITLPAAILIVASVLRDMATFARVGILISFVIYLCAYFLYKSYVRNFFTFNRSKMIIMFLATIIIIVAGASTVRLFRGTYENMSSSSRELKSFGNNLIITPSVYLYLSSNIGVFSKYLDRDEEHPFFAENTLAPVYRFLSKFGLTEKVPFHQKGYYIPMWTNSSTYLRELHSDFGYPGVIFIPYLLAFFTSVLWIKFKSNGSVYTYVILTMLFSLITLTFFSMIIRGPEVYLSIFLLFVILPSIKALVKKRINKVVLEG